MHLAREICSAKLPCIAQFEHLSVCNLPPSPPIFGLYMNSQVIHFFFNLCIFAFRKIPTYIPSNVKKMFCWKNNGMTRAGRNCRHFDIFDKYRNSLSILSVIGCDWGVKVVLSACRLLDFKFANDNVALSEKERLWLCLSIFLLVSICDKWSTLHMKGQ